MEDEGKTLGEGDTEGERDVVLKEKPTAEADALKAGAADREAVAGDPAG